MVTLKYKHKKRKLKYEVGDLPVGIKKLKYVETRNKIQKKKNTKSSELNAPE